MSMQLVAPPTNGVCSRLLKRLWTGTICSRSKSCAVDSTTTSESETPSVAEGIDEQAMLVQRFMDLGRSALLLRPAIVQSIAAEHVTRIQEHLRNEMVFVSQGNVQLTDWLCDAEDGDNAPDHLEHVDAFYIDRFQVTNKRYQEFVKYGGYQQEAVWDSTIWPRVTEFVDHTGAPGPRYWSGGQFPAGTAELPVVGISWFEADAFARWTGKRLPADPEWVKVAACPAATTGTVVQRRYPWGDIWDPACSNLWISGIGKPAPVNQFSEGSSASGVQQLIGNVWEWMSSDLRPAVIGSDIHFDSPLKSVRGGAFDTYFENQTTCHMQSGETSIARRHNVGFRCALSAGDIAGWEPAL